MTTFLRWTIRVHKWFALIVGIQIILWIAGGVVMTVLSIENVRGEHNIATPARIGIEPAGLISPQSALDALGLDGGALEVRLQTWQDRPVYNVFRLDGSSSLVDARSGERLTPISEETAVAIALSDYAGDPQIDSVEFFAEPTWEYRRPGSAWRISFADGEGTRIYVSPDTGLVTARRNDRWRFFDFFWMLHIMDYEEREDFNTLHLQVFAVLALISVLAGFVLLVIRMQRLIRMEMAKREMRRLKPRATP
jgi:uncharacterized iron-regulated membrane protein